MKNVRLPKCRNRRPLSWTKKRQLLSRTLSKSWIIGLLRKFWFCSSNWFYHKSNKEHFYFYFLHYLEDGIGEPCAGQLRENIRFSMTLKVPKVSDEVGNIGFADPMGSTKFIHTWYHVVLQLKLERIQDVLGRINKKRRS